jgi:hypothetical protein
MDNGGLEKNEEMENRLKNGFQNFPGKTIYQKNVPSQTLVFSRIDFDGLGQNQFYLFYKLKFSI